MIRLQFPGENDTLGEMQPDKVDGQNEIEIPTEMLKNLPFTLDNGVICWNQALVLDMFAL